MNIGFVHPNYPGGQGTGATFSATQIVRGLSNQGHKLQVYCLQKPENIPDWVSKRVSLHDISESGFSPHPTIQRNTSIDEQLESIEEIDVLHSYLPSTIPSIARIGEAFDLPTVISLNAYKGVCPKNDLMYKDNHQCSRSGPVRCSHCVLNSTMGDGYFSDITHTSARFLDIMHQNRIKRYHPEISAYHALSEHVASRYSEFGYAEDRIEVIPNIRDEHFNVEHTSNLEPPIRLLYVGSLKPNKGVDRLLPLVKSLNSRSNNTYSLTIIGSGEYGSKLRSEMSRLSLSDKVHFKGDMEYDNLPDIYASHDIFVYPGRWDEPFGRVFLEAMSAGTPIIASDVGSVNRIIGSAGRVVDGSISSFVSEITNTVKNEDLKNMSHMAKEELHNYNMGKVISKFETTYQDCIEK